MSPSGSAQLEHPGQDGGLHPPCRDRLRGPPEELGKPSRERAFWLCHLKTAAPATLTSVKDVGIFSFKEILRSEVLPRHQSGFFRMKNRKLYSFVGFLICKYVNIIFKKCRSNYSFSLNNHVYFEHKIIAIPEINMQLNLPEASARVKNHFFPVPATKTLT